MSWELAKLRYRITGLSESYTSQASLRALQPLVGLWFPQGTGRDEARDLITRELSLISDRRRRRLRVLASANWARLATAAQRTYADNCPPVCLKRTEGTTASCWFTQLCPWCWCREYVEPLWVKLAALLFPFPGSARPSGYSLVEVQSVMRYSPNYTLPVVHEYPQKRMAKFYRQYPHWFLGGATLCSVEPPVYTEPLPCWRVRHRMLAIWHAQPERELTFPRENLFGCKSINYQPSLFFRSRPVDSKLTLAKIVGSYARYPSRLLHCHPVQLKEMLEWRERGWPAEGATTGVRKNLSSLYGALRWTPGKGCLPPLAVPEEKVFTQIKSNQEVLYAEEDADCFAEEGLATDVGRAFEPTGLIVTHH